MATKKKEKSVISLEEFKEIPLRSKDSYDGLSQINIFIEKEKRTALKMFAIKNSSSVSGIVVHLIDLLLKEVNVEETA